MPFQKGHQINKGSKTNGTKPKGVFIKEAMTNQVFVEAMKSLRDDIVIRMRETMSKADYRALNDSLDKMTKNIQLLSGESTENVRVIDGINFIYPNENNATTNTETNPSMGEVV